LRHSTADAEVRGIEGSKRPCQTYTSSFPDAQFEIQQIVAEGDAASAQLVFTGTHNVPLGEIPVSGNFVNVANNCCFRFADGKLVERKGVCDSLSLMRQINADLLLIRSWFWFRNCSGARCFSGQERRRGSAQFSLPLTRKPITRC
jgi:predicted ester cyclase